MPVTATDIAKQVPNAGSGAAIIEDRQVILRRDISGDYVWAAESPEREWEVYSSTSDAVVVPQQSAREIAGALVREFTKLPPR